MFLQPPPRIQKRLHPRRNIIPLSVRRVIRPVPPEHRTLEVRHRHEVAAICAGEHSSVVVAAVRVGRVDVEQEKSIGVQPSIVKENYQVDFVSIYPVNERVELIDVTFPK